MALPVIPPFNTVPPKKAIFGGTVVKLCHPCQRTATTSARDLSIPAGPSPKALRPPQISTKTHMVIFLVNSSCHRVATKGHLSSEHLLYRFPSFPDVCDKVEARYRDTRNHLVVARSWCHTFNTVPPKMAIFGGKVATRWPLGHHGIARQRCMAEPPFLSEVWLI